MSKQGAVLATKKSARRVLVGATTVGVDSRGNAQQSFGCHFVSHIVRTYLNLTTTRAAEDVFRKTIPFCDTRKC
jgi:hypothetical protein